MTRWEQCNDEIDRAYKLAKKTDDIKLYVFYICVILGYALKLDKMTVEEAEREV